MFIVIEAVESLCNVHDMSGYDGRFVFFCCIGNDFRQLVQQSCQLIGTVASQIRSVYCLRICSSGCSSFAGISQNACTSCIGILYIRTGFTIEIQNLVPAEYIVFDSVVGQFVEYNGTYTNLSCDFFNIVGSNALFLNDFTGFVDCLIQYIFQEYHTAVSGGHGAFFQAYQTEWNVYNILAPFISHQLDNSLQLLEVEVLLRSYYIDILHEVVGIHSVLGSSDVSGNIDGGTVGLDYRCVGQAELAQFYDFCTLGRYQQVLVTHFLDDCRHLVRVERFPCIRFKGNSQQIVYTVEFLQGFITEPLP